MCFIRVNNMISEYVKYFILFKNSVLLGSDFYKYGIIKFCIVYFIFIFLRLVVNWFIFIK